MNLFSNVWGINIFRNFYLLVSTICRIIGLVGRYSEVKDYYAELIRGIVGASEYDPYSVRAFGPEDFSHRDGWGRFSLFVGLGNRIASYMYKSLSPIFVDKPKEFISKTDLFDLADLMILEFIHARAASSGMPINFFSVQPFEVITRNGSRLILVHNGSIYKEKLASEIETRLSEEAIKKYSDSYILALKLAESIEREFDPSILAQFKDYVKTALNLGIILISDDHIVKVFGSYYRKDLPKEYQDYYRMYMVTLGSENIMYASSTLIDFVEYKPKSISQWKEIQNGTYYFVRIDLSKIKDIHVYTEKYLI